MQGSPPPNDLLRIGELEIRPTGGLVVAGGRALRLTVREFELLVALAERAGRVVRREDLFALVWGGTLRRGDRSIDVYVHRLRVKLEDALPATRYIHTHIGFGYRLSPERSHDFHTASTGR
jgi:DNA-binding response OmpR family regulator